MPMHEVQAPGRNNEIVPYCEAFHLEQAKICEYMNLDLSWTNLPSFSSQPSICIAAISWERKRMQRDEEERKKEKIEQIIIINVYLEQVE